MNKNRTFCEQIMNFFQYFIHFHRIKNPSKDGGFLFMHKYETLASHLTDQIARNLQNGISKLPTEAELCRQHHVSRQTVRSALALLQAQGIISSRQGSGSYATGLSDQESRNIIPILISSQQESIYPVLLSDIRTGLANNGYRLQVCETNNNTFHEREHLLTLLNDPPRIMIVEGCRSALPNPNLDLYMKLRQSHTSLLFLHSQYASLSDAICIKDDNYYGGYLLARHLTSLGHTQIAALLKIDDVRGHERYFGIVSCLRDLGLFLKDENVGWFTSPNLEKLEKLQDTRFLTCFIQDCLQDCSAVICYNDEIAYWLIHELSRSGIAVPERISIVCFENSYLSDLSPVPITALSHKPHETGESIVSCAVQMLKGIPAVSQEIPWQLIRRESSAPCPP